jgi:hypothetical protein
MRGGLLVGKLSLIDLAGSERGVDNDNTDKLTRKEGRDINTSLLALKEVIRSMQQNSHHAPFRQSKLTQVLEESLTGPQCQTVVVACVSGAEANVQHTINTLRYASDLRPQGSKPSKKVATTVSADSVVSPNSGNSNNNSAHSEFPSPGNNNNNNSSSSRSAKAVKAEKRSDFSLSPAAQAAAADKERQHYSQSAPRPSTNSSSNRPARLARQTHLRKPETAAEAAASKLSQSRGRSVDRKSTDMYGNNKNEEVKGGNGSGGGTSSFKSRFLNSARRSLSRSKSRTRTRSIDHLDLDSSGDLDEDEDNDLMLLHDPTMPSFSAAPTPIKNKSRGMNVTSEVTSPVPHHRDTRHSVEQSSSSAVTARGSSSNGNNTTVAAKQTTYVPPATNTPNTTPPAPEGRKSAGNGNGKDKAAKKAIRGSGLFGLRRKSITTKPRPPPQPEPPAAAKIIPQPDPRGDPRGGSVDRHSSNRSNSRRGLGLLGAGGGGGGGGGLSSRESRSRALSADYLATTREETDSNFGEGGGDGGKDGGDGVVVQKDMVSTMLLKPSTPLTTQLLASMSVELVGSVMERFGANTAALVLEVLDNQGVEVEKDMVHVEWDVMAEAAKTKGMKTVQLNKLKEWVKGTTDQPPPPITTTPSSSSVSRTAAHNNNKSATTATTSSSSRGSHLSGPRKSPKASNNGSSSHRHHHHTPNPTTPSSSTATISTTFLDVSSLEAAAELLGFGWDGLGFDLYWRLAEEAHMYTKTDWPHPSGNPFLTLLVMQRFCMRRTATTSSSSRSSRLLSPTASITNTPTSGGGVSRRQRPSALTTKRSSSLSNLNFPRSSSASPPVGRTGGNSFDGGLSSGESRSASKASRGRAGRESKDAAGGAEASLLLAEEDIAKEVSTALPSPKVLCAFDQNWVGLGSGGSGGGSLLSSASLLGAKCFLKLGRESEAAEASLLALGINQADLPFPVLPPLPPPPPPPSSPPSPSDSSVVSSEKEEVSISSNNDAANRAEDKEAEDCCLAAAGAVVAALAKKEQQASGKSSWTSSSSSPSSSSSCEGPLSKKLAVRVGGLQVLGRTLAGRGQVRAAEVYFLRALEDAKRTGQRWQQENKGNTGSSSSSSSSKVGMASLLEVSAVLDLKDFVMDEDNAKKKKKSGSGEEDDKASGRSELSVEVMIEDALKRGGRGPQDADALLFHRRKINNSNDQEQHEL